MSAPSNLIVVPSIVMLPLHPLDISVVTLAPTELAIHDAIIVGTALCLSDELKEPVTLTPSMLPLSQTFD